MIKVQFIFFLTISLLLFVGCSNPIDDGLDSLEGYWTIGKIVEIENEILSQGTFNISQVENDMPIGFFNFLERELSYEYSLSTGTYMGSESYVLNHERVNSGFTKIDQFTLIIGTRSFDITFGDETKNSFQNATQITLTETTSNNTLEMVVIFELLKE